MSKPLSELGRRERQIMDIVVRRQRATAADVLGDLPDPPSYSAVVRCSACSKTKATSSTSGRGHATCSFLSPTLRASNGRRPSSRANVFQRFD